MIIYTVVEKSKDVIYPCEKKIKFRACQIDSLSEKQITKNIYSTYQ